MLKRSPLKRRPRKKRPTDDPTYLAWIRSLPCIIPNCSFVGKLFYHIEAHHAGDHGLGQKAPDRTAIPLCNFHHREGRSSAHELGKFFWQFHRLDRAVITSKLNNQYERYKSQNV